MKKRELKAQLAQLQQRLEAKDKAAAEKPTPAARAPQPKSGWFGPLLIAAILTVAAIWGWMWLTSAPRPAQTESFGLVSPSPNPGRPTIIESIGPNGGKMYTRVEPIEWQEGKGDCWSLVDGQVPCEPNYKGRSK